MREEKVATELYRCPFRNSEIIETNSCKRLRAKERREKMSQKERSKDDGGRSRKKESKQESRG